jgi:glycosyltransferase involved in cell wall biosynthesis
MDKIEILLATYNGGRFLREQLDSIFKQSYQNFALLVRDDGSTDDTLDILNEYIIKYPQQISIVEDEVAHRGATFSFEYLIQKATAKYFMLCDQDDVWLPNKIEVCIKTMKELEAVSGNIPLMVFTDLKEVDTNLNIINQSFIDSQKLFPEVASNPIKILSLNVVAGCTMMINQESKAVILPFPSSNVVHDQWIAINIAHYGMIKYLPIPTILYRQHGSNSVGANRVGFKYFYKKLLVPSKQFKIYNDLINNLSFKINIWSFVYYKIYFTIRRLTI